jgi:hypothetical protein
MRHSIRSHRILAIAIAIACAFGATSAEAETGWNHERSRLDANVASERGEAMRRQNFKLMHHHRARGNHVACVSAGTSEKNFERELGRAGFRSGKDAAFFAERNPGMRFLQRERTNRIEVVGWRTLVDGTDHWVTSYTWQDKTIDENGGTGVSEETAEKRTAENEDRMRREKSLSNGGAFDTHVWSELIDVEKKYGDRLDGLAIGGIIIAERGDHDRIRANPAMIRKTWADAAGIVSFVSIASGFRPIYVAAPHCGGKCVTVTRKKGTRLVIVPEAAIDATEATGREEWIALRREKP